MIIKKNIIASHINKHSKLSLLIQIKIIIINPLKFINLIFAFVQNHFHCVFVLESEISLCGA